mmetsp:Transcript_18836/g.75575  ORF Transcript_18836/g.75575 Transcript_18836/m.75575 type:complete len:237 (+) Transcript_18836:420-1130(+)|eukprot:CAMPEP_0113971460 /NCGR_PEP_ID=MMETSP0011_2-20120614/12263_1 /TAXON_ID=101924 /ORGANISM="Rhodosorus marinus" /LENGTH=236 /DNA_ID=CAMNT_0000986987 /DNA_START=250 /DNA_END=960 /DNA_ORIENTATION=- /assembly_acc=CAM_ASM_000156
MNLAFLWKAASSSFLFPVAVAYAGIKVLDATFFRKNTAPLALHEKEGTDEGDVLKNEKEESVIWISVLLFKFWSQWATNLEDEILKLIYPMVVEARPQIFPYLAVSDISIGTEPPYVVSVKTFSNPDPRTLIVDCLLEWISPDNQITLRTGLTHGPRVMKASNLSIKARTRFVSTHKIRSSPPHARCLKVVIICPLYMGAGICCLRKQFHRDPLAILPVLETSTSKEAPIATNKGE